AGQPGKAGSCAHSVVQKNENAKKRAAPRSRGRRVGAASWRQFRGILTSYPLFNNSPSPTPPEAHGGPNIKNCHFDAASFQEPHDSCCNNFTHAEMLGYFHAPLTSNQKGEAT